MLLTSWLAKEREAAESVVTDAVPVPFKENDGGFPERLLFNVSVPLVSPSAVGAKATLTEQFAPAARELPQLLV